MFALPGGHQPGSGAHAQTVVFFCHGGGGNQDQWRLRWRALQALGYSLVAWDLLGHGLSDKPREPAAYSWARLVEDYLRIVQRYGGARNVLVGQSFGSGLTLSAAAQLPGTVQGLLLLGSQLQRPLGKGGLLKLPVWLLTLLRARLAKGFRERAWHPDTDPRLIAYEEDLTRHNRLDVFKALVIGAQWPDLPTLASLDLPIIILAGESDGLTPPEAGRALHEHLPNSRFEVLACGHQLMLEQPDQVTARLLGLLAERLGSGQRAWPP